MRSSVCFWQSVAPKLKRIPQHLLVVESVVARHLRADEIGLFVGLVLTLQFYFGHDETFVVAVKLINLKHVFAATHQIAPFVDDSTPTEFQQLSGLVGGDFFFKLIARQSAINAFALDGQESLVGVG